jgi:hypothetical protein
MIPRLQRLPIAASTLLLSLSVAAVGINLDANHPCIEVLGDTTSVLFNGKLFNGKSPSEFIGTAWECVSLAKGEHPRAPEEQRYVELSDHELREYTQETLTRLNLIQQRQ